ncbi:hypothetical protein Tcan_02326 [Toxocara canis]|uniref:Uncharacterized protein n=1 Tax=Toxocara canis TaxID=6265 RepID=A0A0B2UR33_TOXCA|nr:hypothetical protein Tcan_02326 [Toxocara canis]
MPESSTSSIINMVCYFWIGFVLAALNLPVAFAIVTKSELCVRYGVLLSMFFTCGIAGLTGLLKAVYRVIVWFALPGGDNHAIDGLLCLFNVS